ncbi:sentrin-specific protease 7 isoform X2 [Pleurodeles waltl]|uniref:sentrin-specific protease 7 isoform X2 n=1 Tax=Pleurodeles waltl TaxID=8319 RepID=UPI00370945A1
MEEQKNKSPCHDKGPTPPFKIPKKKSNSLSEAVKVSSPLSQSEFQKSLTQEKHRTSSYSEYNISRNYDSFIYYSSTRYLSRRSLTPTNPSNRHDQHRSLTRSPFQQSLPSGEESKSSVFPSASGCSQELEGNQKSDNSKQNEKYVDSSSLGLEGGKDLELVNRRRKCSSPPAEKYRTFSIEKTTPLSELSCRSSPSSTSSKSSSEKIYFLRKKYPSKIQLELNISQPLNADQKEIISSFSMDVPFSDTKNPGLENCSKAEHRTNIGTDKLKPREKLFNTRRFRERPCCKKPSSNKVEPIVLSSDEDESSTDLENMEDLDSSTSQECLPDKKEPELNSKPLLSEKRISQEEQTTEQHMKEEEQRCRSVMRQISSDKHEEISSVLEIAFKTVYIGRKKGRSKGCAKFSSTSVEIPLYEAISSTLTLCIDCCHLRKCGLWTNISEMPLMSSAFIFLWMAKDYVPEIQKQLHNPASSPPGKANEFIFLELCRPLTDKEEDKLCEFMVKWSMYNRHPELSDLLPWEEANTLLKDLSKDECSFLSSCNISCYEEKSTQTDTKQKSQESNVTIFKNSYTLMRKCNLNSYAVSLIPKPGGEWQEIKVKGTVQKLIVYPPPPTKGGLGVTQEDLECLEHGEFLNDVIIDFYLKYLLLEKIPQHLVERSHIFSSFFFRCLTRTESNLTDENPDTSPAQRRHRGVRTWTRHVDIFEKDFIFVPVNEESHWYLAVICFPWLEKAVYEERKFSNEPQYPVKAEEQEDPARKSTVIVFNDAYGKKEELSGNGSPHSEGNDRHTSEAASPASKISKGQPEKQSGKTKTCKRPCILIFDSLKASSAQNTVHVLREYLEVEWNVKRKTSREFSRSSMRDFYPRVPKQDNSSDCGVYLLQYVESFFQSPIPSFEPPLHMEQWFPRHVVRSKREEIRNLILRLHLQQSRRNNS